MAARWLPDTLTGVELGCSTHNRLAPHAPNVAPADDFEFYAAEGRRLFDNEPTPVDFEGEATALPFADSSLDFVASSHVLEHCPNLLGALEEIHRVLRGDGVNYVVYPHPDALEADRDLPLTTLGHLIDDRTRRETADTHRLDGVPGGRRGHYHRLRLSDFLRAVAWLNSVPGRPLYEVAETADRDDVVGNGWVCVLKAVKG
jgi:SAM-dependent methyltransferase